MLDPPFWQQYLIVMGILARKLEIIMEPLKTALNEPLSGNLDPTLSRLFSVYRYDYFTVLRLLSVNRVFQSGT
jgi:hypothetical protein